MKKITITAALTATVIFGLDAFSKTSPTTSCSSVSEQCQKLQVECSSESPDKGGNDILKLLGVF